MCIGGLARTNGQGTKTHACTRFDPSGVERQGRAQGNKARPRPRAHPSSSSVILMPGAGVGGLEGWMGLWLPPLRPWNGEMGSRRRGGARTDLASSLQGPGPRKRCHDRARDDPRHKKEMPTKALEGLGRLGGGWRGGPGGNRSKKKQGGNLARACVCVLTPRLDRWRRWLAATGCVARAAQVVPALFGVGARFCARGCVCGLGWGGWGMCAWVVIGWWAAEGH